jgi:hypothetical protein
MVPGIPVPPGVQCAPPAQAELCNPYEDRNGPLLVGNPFLDGKTSSPPGWFGAAEVDVVGTHIKNHLINSITTGSGFMDTVHLPTAPLDWTGSPRFELGYRFGQGAGDFVLSYRFLATSGRETLFDFDAAGNPGNLHSRLNINVWDIDYGNWENSLLPWGEMRWRIGARIASNFFDSQAVSPLLEQRTSNYFVGGGPHAGVDLRWCLSDTGLALVGRIEGAILCGSSHDSYEEVFFGGPGGPDGGASRFPHVQVVPVLNVQAAVEWVPLASGQLHVSAGYTYERWWDYAGTGGELSDMFTQGVFFRFEFRY